MDQDDSKPQQASLMLNQAENIISIKSLKKKVYGKRMFKRLIFSTLWLYLIIKLFIVDVDIWIAKSLGLQNTSIYLILRLVVFSTVLFLLWKVIGNKRFFKNLGLFLIFPIYPGFWLFIKFFLWTLPSFLAKRNLHFVLYSYIELIINFISEFKKDMLKIIAFITSLFILFNLDSYWMIVTMVLLTILQISHIHRRYKQAFGPMKIFRMNFNADIDNGNPFSIEKIDQQIGKNTSNGIVTEQQKIFDEMEQVLMMCELSDVMGVKIKNILNNSTYLKSLFWKIIYSFFISVVFFTGINYALYKFDPSNFKVDSIPNFFNFFYYSFFTIFADGTDISPITVISKFLRIAGFSVGVILNLVILVFYVTTITDKFKQNLNGLITYFESYSKQAKEYFNEKYKNHPAAVIEKLKNNSNKIKNGLMVLDFIFGKKK